MARVNVYLPDDLADEAKVAGLNVSALTQAALREALAVDRTTKWLDSLRRLEPKPIAHEDVLRAVHEAKSDFER